jgi:hypothetical protein
MSRRRQEGNFNDFINIDGMNIVTNLKVVFGFGENEI